MRVLIDVNVVLDFFFNRIPWADQAEQILQAVAADEVTGILCATSIDHLFYLGRKLGGLREARRAVEICLQMCEIAPVNIGVLQMALRAGGTDFEDDTVLASGILAGAEIVCTRDASGFKASPLPVMTPAELLTRIAKQ